MRERGDLHVILDAQLSIYQYHAFQHTFRLEVYQSELPRECFEMQSQIGLNVGRDGGVGGGSRLRKRTDVGKELMWGKCEGLKLAVRNTELRRKARTR